MKLAAIHHVAIIVSDYEKSKDFYVNKLGFAIVRENFRKERNDWKLDLRVGEGADAIELEIFAEPNPPKRVNQTGSLRTAASSIPGGGCGSHCSRTGTDGDRMRTDSIGQLHPKEDDIFL